MIDTSIANILVSNNLFNIIYSSIKNFVEADDVHVSSRVVQDSKERAITIDTNCDNIINKLPNIDFVLDNNYRLRIGPNGYVHASMPSNDFCNIGISYIPYDNLTMQANNK